MMEFMKPRLELEPVNLTLFHWHFCWSVWVSARISLESFWVCEAGYNLLVFYFYVLERVVSILSPAFCVLFQGLLFN